MKTFLLVAAIATPVVAFMVLLMLYVDGTVGATALLVAMFAVFAVAGTALVFHGSDLIEGDSPPTDLR